MIENILIAVSIFIILTNILMLGTSRLGVMIKGISFQGVLISLLPLLLFAESAEISHLIIIAFLTILVKGFMIPKLLHNAIKSVDVKRELHPFVGYFSSVLFGLFAFFLSTYILEKMPFYYLVVSPIHAITAMASILIATFIIASRKNVLAQVIGFLIFENAGFILSIALAAKYPLLIELGILVDLLAGILIMGIAMKFIHLHFNTIGIHSLERLNK